jgi:plastocyanin
MHMRSTWMAAVAVVAVLGAAAACGGGGGGSPTAPSDGGGTGGGGTGGGGSTATNTITIGSDGRVSPANITIAVGTRVTFVNNHNRNHDMASDPHPSHEDCPPMDQVGFLTPGQSKTSGNFNIVRRCGFHDHNEPSTTALQGTITIQ